MKPGSYLRQCREAAGLTLDDVALRTETVPPVSARARADWLATIEADTAPLAITTALRLHTIYAFDWQILFACCADHLEIELAAAAVPPAALAISLRPAGAA